MYGFSVAKAPYFKFKPTANKMSSKRKSSVKQALEMSIQEPTAKRNKRLSNDLNNSTLASPSNNELLKIEEPETKTNQPFKQISQSTFTSQSKSELEVRGQTVDQICKYITTTEMATIKATEGTVTTQAATEAYLKQDQFCIRIGVFKSLDEDKQITLFEHHYENGYDIFLDQDYVAWLNQYHPSFLVIYQAGHGWRSSTAATQSYKPNITCKHSQVLHIPCQRVIF